MRSNGYGVQLQGPASAVKRAGHAGQADRQRSQSSFAEAKLRQSIAANASYVAGCVRLTVPQPAKWQPVRD